MRPTNLVLLTILVPLAYALHAAGLGLASEGTSSRDFDMEILVPDGVGPFPAILLMHGCAGLTAPVADGLKVHARYFQKHGFVTAIVDSFGPRDKGGGKVCQSLEEIGYARYYRLKDAFQAKTDLSRHPSVDPQRIFLIGQSNGGSVALLAAARGGPSAVEGSEAFRAVVAYYPWCAALPPNPALISPLLVLGAGLDDWVSAEDCQGRFSKTKGAAAEVVIYPEAHHSFDLAIPFQAYAGRHIGGDPDATEDSRHRILAFFKRHMTNAD